MPFVPRGSRVGLLLPAALVTAMLLLFAEQTAAEPGGEEGAGAIAVTEPGIGEGTGDITLLIDPIPAKQGYRLTARLTHNSPGTSFASVNVRFIFERVYAPGKDDSPIQNHSYLWFSADPADIKALKLTISGANFDMKKRLGAAGTWRGKTSKPGKIATETTCSLVTKTRRVSLDGSLVFKSGTPFFGTVSKGRVGATIVERIAKNDCPPPNRCKQTILLQLAGNEASGEGVVRFFGEKVHRPGAGLALQEGTRFTLTYDEPVKAGQLLRSHQIVVWVKPAAFKTDTALKSATLDMAKAGPPVGGEKHLLSGKIAFKKGAGAPVVGRCQQQVGGKNQPTAPGMSGVFHVVGKKTYRGRTPDSILLRKDRSED